MKDKILRRLSRLWIVVALAALGALAIVLWPPFQINQARAEGLMPEFTAGSADAWINSAPLKRAHLRGKVVLLEIWTSI